MPSKGLPAALASLLTIAGTSRADEPSSVASLEQRAAERGPIRKQLEAARAALVVEASPRPSLAREPARRAASRQGSSGSMPFGAWALVTLAVLVVAYLWWAGQWAQI